MKKIFTFIFAAALSLLALFSVAAAVEKTPTELPVKGMVTMIDLGAHKCIPCKMMAPILAELKEEYKGRAAIVFLDVWEDRSLPSQYRIRVIPTQIFYDKQGKEVMRHEGFLAKKDIELVLRKLGVNKPVRKQ
ncbi:MAG: thioredoxin family protein [Desulfarculaceae bacterium]|jgi:thioredoxin 1